MSQRKGPRGHSIGVVFSERSRAAYAAEALAAGETYSFTDAWGRPRTWLKGEHAYLAPNGAVLLLSRCNLKHDFVEEGDLSAEVLAGYRLLLVADGAHLDNATIRSIQAWHANGRGCLVVAGKTNLPPQLLGLQTMSGVDVAGY